MYICVCVYIYVCVCVCVCIYIYIQRKRKRKADRERMRAYLCFQNKNLDSCVIACVVCLCMHASKQPLGEYVICASKAK